MNSFPDSWPLPERRVFAGQFVTLTPLGAGRDAAPLFAASHGTPEIEALWRYLPYGPFADENDLRDWLLWIQDGDDPLFFTVNALDVRQPAGMISILNIVPEHGRAELGHIWYSPAVQRTNVNTETVYLPL